MQGQGVLFGQIAAVFSIVIAGVWSATQWTAAALGYQLRLGSPWFDFLGTPVYHPWRLFEWWFFFDAYAPHVFDIGGAIAGASGLVAVLVAIGMSLWRSRQSKLVTTYGSARWADATDIRKAGLNQPAGVFLGLHDGQYLRHEGPEHVLTFAPTRSGKGVGLVVPTLLSWPASAVVHDIKGENWQITAGWRSRFSHCLLFNPTDPKSAAYNPLLEVRRGAHEVRDVQNIADILVDPEGALERRNHWEKTSHALLVGAILHVLYAGEDKTLRGVANFLSDPACPFELTLHRMMTTRHLGETPHPVVASAAREVLNKSDNERSGVLSTAMSFLGLYRDPTVAEVTSRCDWRIADLISSAHPVSLYLVVPPSDISRTKPLVRLILNQIGRRLTESLDGSDGIARRHKLLLMLDEFPALGRLDFFETALAFMAGYGIRSFLIAQSLNQIDKAYGQNHSILDNCHVRVTFATNDERTAKRISETLGTATELRAQRNYAGHRLAPWLGHLMVSRQETARPLLTPGEVSHFESVYHLTLQYLPAEESRARAAKLLYENTPTQGVDWRERLSAFVAETDRIYDLLDGVMPEIAWLDDSQTLTYLHATVSTRRYRVGVPEVPFHLDALLADAPLIGGLAPMLGDQHLRVVTVRGFPTSTWPGILDDLNRLGFAYRWSTRFLCMDKAEAEKELGRLRRQWFAKRKSVLALLRETIFQQESPLVDTDASNKASDADVAMQELGSDQVAFGYVTATVTVFDADGDVADEKLRRVERVIQGRGFVTIPETLNAVEAWLSSVPGNAYANVRQPIVSTLNLAHLMPVSAVWAGPEKNEHLDGPPLIVTRTEGATPFRLVTHIGDVGHTLVAGPTGMGKSVLLAILAMQFRRYPGSRIFAFDMGRSMRATILGLGGEHYDLGADGAIAFQPLARIDREGYRTWAAEWIEGRFRHEGVSIGPDEKVAIWSALGSLAGAPVEQRTLTGFSVLLQSNALRLALAPYVLGGAHGKLLDADSDRLGVGDVQCFEMEELMHSKAAVLAVLGYLFARFDERFDGAPTLLILDEAWLFLDDPVFAARIRQWLKTLRKKNVSVIFATQSLADIKDSTIAPAIIESCASRIFLPNPQAAEPQIRTIYEGFGLNARQIEIVATAQPKRDYYYQSRLGNRLFDLDLGPVALAFAGASTPQDQRAIDGVLRDAGTPEFAGAWLRHRGLDWAADLLPSAPSAASFLASQLLEISP